MNTLIHNNRRHFPGRILFFVITFGLVFIHCQTRSSNEQTDEVEEQPTEITKSTTNNNSDMMTKDVLIIVSDAASEEAKKMAAKIPIRQEISERVRIVNLDAAQAAELTKQTGIYIVEGKTLAPEALSSLSVGEKLFVDGWLARTPDAEKERAGEGLKWDDPNFQPPDSLKE